MKIALYDVDSTIPNLALMKVSAYHKNIGDNVVRYDPLFINSYDKIYASTIFNYSDKSNLLLDRMEIGGSGWDIEKDLPPCIEKEDPDYSFYNYPHSMGFSMRGCRYRCKFCIVPQKEGKPKPFNTINEIWTNRNSNFIVLLDNDFFGNIFWRDRIKEIRDYDLKVNFSQGINIRIITDEEAAALASVKFRNIKCDDKHPMIHFAWDRTFDEKMVDAGICRVLKAGIKPYQITFYILIGFDSTPEQDMYRVMKTKNYGINPFVMSYKRTDPYQKRFARWVNHKAIFNSVKWENYK